MSKKSRPIVFVSGGEGGGGVLALVRELAPAVATIVDTQVIHLGVVNLPYSPPQASANFTVQTLSVDANDDPRIATGAFLYWLTQVRPSVVVFNDVSQLEHAWRRIPISTKVVVVLHDEARSYIDPILKAGRRIDAIIVVASYLKTLLVSRSPNLECKIYVVRNGVGCPNVFPSTRTLIQSRSARVLFVGGLDWMKKGVQDLPKLAIELRRRGLKFELHIVGGQDERLERLFQKQSLDSHVIWHGRVTKQELFSIADRCDFFFLPSRVEPFGLVTVEAMAMGCIPFAYDIEAGTREIIKSGENGFLLPVGDAASVARTMVQVFMDPPLMDAVREASVNTARQEFELARCAVEYADLLLKLSLTNESERVRELNWMLDDRTPSLVSFNFLIVFKRRIVEMVGRYPLLVRFAWRRFM